MEEKMIHQLEFDNGLTLQLIERSKKMALDRYFVSLIARMTIPVEGKWFGQSAQAEHQAQNIASALGQSLVFEKKLDRNFVDEEEKERIVFDFCHSIKSNLARYYSHPDFPKKFILKQYEAFLKRKSQPG
jgi:hypothetical protein